MITKTCAIDEVPLGSMLLEDIYSSLDLLVVPSYTVITESVLSMVKRYRDEIVIGVEEIIKDNNSLAMSKYIQERAVKGVEYMHSLKNAGEVYSVAQDIASDLCEAVTDNDSIYLNLKKLHLCDEYTFKHCIDVATMGMLVGKRMGFTIEEIREIGTAGLLHDLGKLDISLDILNKPGKLTKEEFDIIKKHPVYGYKRLKSVNGISRGVLEGVLDHHENIDGSGYPRGLRGSNISRMGRVLSVVDVYDALVTERPYKSAKSPVVSYEMVLGMFNKFDCEVVNVFSSCIELYAVSTVLELSNDAKVRVVSQNIGFPHRPIVENIETGEVYDLIDINNVGLVIKDEKIEGES